MGGRERIEIQLKQDKGEYQLVLPDGRRVENARITRVGNNPAIFRHGPITRIQVVVEIPEIREEPGNPQVEPTSLESPRKSKKSHAPESTEEEQGIDEGN